MTKRYKTFNYIGQYYCTEEHELTDGYVKTIEEAREAGKKAKHWISFGVDAGDYCIVEYTMDEETFTLTDKCVEKYKWADHHTEDEENKED